MNTPICLPKKRPHTIPNGTGSNRIERPSPSKDTPALAKANIGIIPKATYGEIVCSTFNNIDFFILILCGMVKASNTPAIVACIPD